MKARIVRIGSTQVIYLPKALPKKAKLGEEVELRAEPGRILISKNVKPRIGWAEAASVCTHATKTIFLIRRSQLDSTRKRGSGGSACGGSTR